MKQKFLTDGIAPFTEDGFLYNNCLISKFVPSIDYHFTITHFRILNESLPDDTLIKIIFPLHQIEFEPFYLEHNRFRRTRIASSRGGCLRSNQLKIQIYVGKGEDEYLFKGQWELDLSISP